jgi:hypothetical protein
MKHAQIQPLNQGYPQLKLAKKQKPFERAKLYYIQCHKIKKDEGKRYCWGRIISVCRRSMRPAIERRCPESRDLEAGFWAMADLHVSFLIERIEERKGPRWSSLTLVGSRIRLGQRRRSHPGSN